MDYRQPNFPFRHSQVEAVFRYRDMADSFCGPPNEYSTPVVPYVERLPACAMPETSEEHVSLAPAHVFTDLDPSLLLSGIETGIEQTFGPSVVNDVEQGNLLYFAPSASSPVQSVDQTMSRSNSDCTRRDNSFQATQGPWPALHEDEQSFFYNASEQTQHHGSLPAFHCGFFGPESREPPHHYMEAQSRPPRPIPGRTSYGATPNMGAVIFSPNSSPATSPAQKRRRIAQHPEQGKMWCKGVNDKGEACERLGRDQIGLCKRCQVKYDRRAATNPTIPYESDMTYEEAERLIYPVEQSKGPPETDTTKVFEDHWIGRFVDAFNLPYSRDGDDNEPSFIFHQRQQKLFNEKVCMEGRYKPGPINARLRFLFRAVRQFHEGGKVILPKSGDNDGYGPPELSLTFWERLEELEKRLKKNKRIVMNVVESRGVIALVGNPAKFDRRKGNNNDSNGKKKGIMEAGKLKQEDQEEDSEDRVPPMRRKRKRSEDEEPPRAKPLIPLVDDMLESPAFEERQGYMY